MCRDGPGYAWERGAPKAEAGIAPKLSLVVEDDPHVRRVIADFLSGRGHDVAEAASGRLALNLVWQHRFDLIISDLRMPELGGRALYEHLGYFQRDLLDRFIVVTGWDDADIEFFQTKTAVPVVRKPFTLAELSETIHRVLQRGPRTESEV
jgi:CheY-like chemotaxis protein